MSPEESAGKLLLEEKVAVVPGPAFGQCGERYVPCCYAPSLSKIEEAPERIGRFIGRHCQKITTGDS
jgi:aminotransferase